MARPRGPARISPDRAPRQPSPDLIDAIPSSRAASHQEPARLGAAWRSSGRLGSRKRRFPKTFTSWCGLILSRTVLLKVYSFSLTDHLCPTTRAPGCTPPVLGAAMLPCTMDGTYRNVERYNAQLSTRQNVVSCLRPEPPRRIHRYGLIGDFELEGNPERQPFSS